ncbi:MAG: DNRLRE domain-containing protein [Clostridia bacterium]
MNSNLKLYCDSTTYIDNFRPNKNFSKARERIIGVVNRKSLQTNNYSMLLKFDMRAININVIESAKLYIYLENGNMEFCDKIIVSKSDSDYENSEVNWDNKPNNYNKIDFEVKNRNIQRYCSFDVTEIIKSSDDFIIGLQIECESEVEYCAINFLSEYSKMPPYLLISISEDSDYYIESKNKFNELSDIINDIKDDIIELKKINYKLDEVRSDIKLLFAEFCEERLLKELVEDLKESIDYISIGTLTNKKQRKR